MVREAEELRANCYLEANGCRRAIRFKPQDIVNIPAPAGFHWERIPVEQEYTHTWQPLHDRARAICGHQLSPAMPDEHRFYYICVQDDPRLRDLLKGAFRIAALIKWLVRKLQGIQP